MGIIIKPQRNSSEHAAIVFEFDTPSLKFWVSKKDAHYIAVFDSPTNTNLSFLHATLFTEQGKTEYPLLAVPANWLKRHSITGYGYVRYETLPESCKTVILRAVNQLLYGVDYPHGYRALRKFRVVLSDGYFECLAETESHAVEQAMDADKQAEVQAVYLIDYTCPT